jgi:hypothetical protein
VLVQSDDDVEGHKVVNVAQEVDDDVEGHKVTQHDDDVEGHRVI